MNLLALLGIGLFILAAGFYAGAETGGYSINPIRLQYRNERGQRSAMRLSGLLNDMEAFVCTTLLGNNVCVYLATALCTAFVSRYVRPSRAEIVSTLLLSPVLLMFAETIPKNLFHRHADGLMYFFSEVLAASQWLFWPVVLMLKAISHVPNMLLGKNEAKEPSWTSQRLHYFLAEGTQEGVLSVYQNRMARNIMRLDTIRLRDVMVPISQVTMAPIDATPEELKRLAAEKGFSRLPVYEGERTHIVGVVTLLDFLWPEAENGHARSIAREPTCFHMDDAIDDALRRLQRKKQPMGIVLDGEDKAIGIVTIKDLVEEVVGELEEW